MEVLLEVSSLSCSPLGHELLFRWPGMLLLLLLEVLLLQSEMEIVHKIMILMILQQISAFNHSIVVLDSYWLISH